MSLQKLTAELYQLYDQEQYESCQKLLVPIKVELVKHNLLAPSESNTRTGDQLNDMKIAERILEIGCLSSLLSSDYQNFENQFAQLKPFYDNRKLHSSKALNDESTKIVSLYMLYLLSQGFISRFHVELESLYNSDHYNTEKDKYLQFPINLEKNLMEGNYIKIWKLLKEEKNLQSKEYRHFVDTLNNTLRYEIAKSLEKAYSSIPISNCKSLLYYPQELSNSVFEETLKENFDVENWRFDNGVITFDTKDHEITSENSSTIANVLSYAERIESII